MNPHTEPVKVRLLRIIGGVLLLFTAINALIAGTLFLWDPSGGKMGMTVTYLQYSPFHDYRIPGLVLLVVIGLLNLVALLVLLQRSPSANKWLRFQGLMLCGWIVVQVLMVRDVQGLHGLMFAIGLLLMCCGALLPSTSSATAPKL